MFENSVNYSFGGEVQMIDRQLKGLKIPDRQRNFDIGQKKKKPGSSHYIRRLKNDIRII